MKKENYPIKKLVIEHDDGLDINRSKMQGTGIYDKDTETFEFMKEEDRPRSATSSKNIAPYTGKYAILRVHKDGSHRITITLKHGLNVEEVKEKIVEEVEACLKKV